MQSTRLYGFAVKFTNEGSAALLISNASHPMIWQHMCFCKEAMLVLLDSFDQLTLFRLYARQRTALEIGHFWPSPREKEGKCRTATAVAQRHEGGLKQARKTTIRALRTKFENRGHEMGASSFPQPRIAPPRH